MSRKVVWRAEARRDFIRHFTFFVREADLATTLRFRSELEGALDLLAGMPTAGVVKPCKSPKLANVRMWKLERFDEIVLLYQPCNEGIRLLRIIHAKQDWRRHL